MILAMTILYKLTLPQLSATLQQSAGTSLLYNSMITTSTDGNFTYYHTL